MTELSYTVCTKHTLEELLFQLCLCNLNLNSLVNLLCVSALVVCIILDGGREQSVDEGCLSEARFASNLKQVSHTSSARSQ